jgi:hypothetical protein
LPRPGIIYHEAEGFFTAAFALRRESEPDAAHVTLVPHIVKGSAKRPDPLHFAGKQSTATPSFFTAKTVGKALNQPKLARYRQLGKRAGIFLASKAGVAILDP